MTPAILFLIFNRPEPTQRVFDALRCARPARLYVAADGPRPTKVGESDLCAKTRRIVDHIDWPCEVRTLFRDQNLGCRAAVSDAITWFFDHEEEGIILEDDCLPSPDFFRFCDVALSTWRHELRVMHIGGHVLIDGPASEDMLFSHLVPIWGWATWRRAWQQYDSEMTRIGTLHTLPLRDWYGSQYRNVVKAIENVCFGKVDAWGARWVLTVMANQGLSVLPRVNLISNIGFGSDATHTTVDSHVASLPLGSLPATLHLPSILGARRAYDHRYLVVMNNPWARAMRVLRRIMLALML